MTATERLKLIEEFKGTVCRCGGKKRAKQSTCTTCYSVLPRHLKNAIYRRFGHGYEEAYTEADRILTENGRERK
jgi:hypothetical protein